MLATAYALLDFKQSLIDLILVARKKPIRINLVSNPRVLKHNNLNMRGPYQDFTTVIELESISNSSHVKLIP